MSWLGHLDHRWTVARHVRHDLGCQLVRSPFLVDQLHLKAPRVGKGQRGAIDVLAVRGRFEGDFLTLRVNQFGGGDVFVQPAQQSQLGPFHHRDMPDIFHGLRIERRVLRKHQFGVSTLKLREFEDANMKRLGRLSLKLHAIRQVGLDRLDVAGECRILQGASHAALLGCLLGLIFNNQGRLGRHAALEVGDDEQRRATFDLSVTRIDLNVGCARFAKQRRGQSRLGTGLAGQGDGDGNQAAKSRRVRELAQCRASR